MGLGTTSRLYFSIILNNLPMELGRKFHEGAEGKDAVARKSRNAWGTPHSAKEPGQPGPSLAFI